MAAALTVLVPLLAAFAAGRRPDWAKSRKEDKALTEGVKSLLRGQIIDLGLHYLREGEIPPYGLDNLENYYTAYVDLGDGDRSTATSWCAVGGCPSAAAGNEHTAQKQGGDFVQDFWKNLAALVKVKTIVTMVVIGVFAAMALAGQFQPDTVMTVGDHGAGLLFRHPERKAVSPPRGLDKRAGDV